MACECELTSTNNTHLKIPGYDLLYPKSWSLQGYARVIVYIKSSLDYQQMHDLKDDIIQSIWIKAGFQNCKKLLWCHAYREHTSTLGSSLRSQKDYLEKFLLQWDQASNLKIGKEPSEVHVVGDMNLDAHHGRWLDPSYHLHSLSQMVQQSCALGNFVQFVSVPT